MPMGCTTESVRRGPAVLAAAVFVTLVALANPSGHLLGASPQAPPVLRSGVDLVTIDVQVAPTKGAAMRSDLTSADFDVTVSGRRREATSVTFLHFDEGTVTGNSLPRGAAGGSDECVFGFHRKDDRRTAHYVLGVDRTDADRKEVKEVRVTIRDKSFAVQRYVWRSPIRRSASLRVARWRRQTA